MQNASDHLSFTFLANYRDFLGSCFKLDFPFCINVLQMQTNVVRWAVKKLSHLRLGQPHGLFLQPHFQSDTIVGLVEDDFSFALIHVIFFVVVCFSLANIQRKTPFVKGFACFCIALDIKRMCDKILQFSFGLLIFDIRFRRRRGGESFSETFQETSLRRRMCQP